MVDRTLLKLTCATHNKINKFRLENKNLVSVNKKKKTCKVLDCNVVADYMIKTIKGRENFDKCLKFTKKTNRVINIVIVSYHCLIILKDQMNSLLKCVVRRILRNSWNRPDSKDKTLLKWGLDTSIRNSLVTCRHHCAIKICFDKYEVINYILSKYSKLDQKEYKNW